MNNSDNFSGRALGFGILLVSLLAPAYEGSVVADQPSIREPDGAFPRPDGHGIGDIFFTPDGAHLVGTGNDRNTRKGAIAFWDVATRRLTRSVKHPASFSAAVFFPDGQRLLTGGWDKKLRILSAPAWEVTHTFDYEPSNHTPQRLAMLPDGKRFLSGNSSLKITGPLLWDVEGLKATRLTGEKRPTFGLAASKDGKRFAVAYAGPIAEIWDAEKLEVVGRLLLEKTATHQGVFASAAFSPDGKTIATGYTSKGAHVGIWDATTFKQLHDCHGFDERAVSPLSVAYSPDSKLIVACTGPDRDRPAHIIVWEVATGKLVYQFHPSKQGGSRMALSPNGRWLVHSGGDGMLRLWDFEKIRREIGK